MAAKASTNARKQDTREKIELGGLVVKAGLRLEKRATLLGALVELAERLRNAPEERQRLTAIGAKIFDNDRI